MTTAPRRAHTLVLSAGGDTVEDLASELDHIAFELRTQGLTDGCRGGPSRGSIWQYRHRPFQTHDAYFAQVDEYLRAKKEVA